MGSYLRLTGRVYADGPRLTGPSDPPLTLFISGAPAKVRAEIPRGSWLSEHPTPLRRARVMIRFVARRAVAPLNQEVQTAMSQIRWLKNASILLVAGATASGVGLLAQNGTPGVASRIEQSPPSARAYDGPVYEVKPGNSIVKVIGTGYLEAARTVDVYNRVEGQTTIIRLVAEGSRVKKGDIVCELDSASLRDQLVNQRISAKSAEAEFENARLTREVAEIAALQYVEGTFRQEQTTLQNEIAAAQTAIRNAESRLEAHEESPHAVQRHDGREWRGQDIRRSPGRARPRRPHRSDRAGARAREDGPRAGQDQAGGPQTHTRDKTTKELTIDVVQKRSAERARKAAWELQTSREGRLERSIAVCTLIAPDDGLVVYANVPNRTRPAAMKEGETVPRATEDLQPAGSLPAPGESQGQRVASQHRFAEHEGQDPRRCLRRSDPERPGLARGTPAGPDELLRQRQESLYHEGRYRESPAGPASGHVGPGRDLPG